MSTNPESCSIVSHGNRHQLVARARIHAPIDDVFAFFSDAGNLDLLTPPFLRFRILTPKPVAMEVGTLIDYRLQLRGFPIRWQSEITAWEPPFRFVDEQRRGPYRLWIHEHCFAEAGGETDVIDRVDYAVPGGRLLHRLIVRRDLVRIFDYRRQRLIEYFAKHSNPCAPREHEPASPSEGAADATQGAGK